MYCCESVLKRTIDDHSRYVVFRLAAPQHAVEALESFIKHRDIVEDFNNLFFCLFEGFKSVPGASQ